MNCLIIDVNSPYPSVGVVACKDECKRSGTATQIKKVTVDSVGEGDLSCSIGIDENSSAFVETVTTENAGVRVDVERGIVHTE
jgi:hypothetical protein